MPLSTDGSRSRHENVRSRRKPRTSDDDSGLASTEVAVLFPLIIVMALFPFQVALYWHAKQTADLAAETALDIGQVNGVDIDEARRAGLAVLSTTGQVEAAEVEVTVVGDLVTAEVSARPRYRIIPGPWRVTALAQGRVERFVGSAER